MQDYLECLHRFLLGKKLHVLHQKCKVCKWSLNLWQSRTSDTRELSICLSSCSCLSIYARLLETQDFHLENVSVQTVMYISAVRISGKMGQHIGAFRPLTVSPMRLMTFFFLLPPPNMAFSEVKHNEGNLILTWYFRETL